MLNLCIVAIVRSSEIAGQDRAHSDLAHVVHSVRIACDLHHADVDFAVAIARERRHVLRFLLFSF